jgi:hypothetical protein
MKTIAALIIVVASGLCLSGCDTPDIRGASLNLGAQSAPTMSPTTANQ